MKRLEELGLTLKGDGGGTHAIFKMEQLSLVNPMTKKQVGAITFKVSPEHLTPTDPPEVRGLPPIAIARLATPTDLEMQLNAAFNDHIQNMQRRSAQLQALGIDTRTDPASLQLTAELEGSGFEFLVSIDKRGAFRVAKARKNGQELEIPPGHSFELNEFRERSGLVGYLVAMFGGEAADDVRPPRGAKADLKALLSYADLNERFGQGALIPPNSAIEVLMVLEAQGQAYRFAAARVSGSTFRGLLAGTLGKLWAERFELDEFQGPRKLLADLLGIAESEVLIVREDGGSA